MTGNDSLWITSAAQAGGTARWMAPDLLDGSSSVVTKESDIYAFGITAWVKDLIDSCGKLSNVPSFVQEIFTGEMPFPNFNFDAQVCMAVAINKQRPERPGGMGDWLWAFLNECWIDSACQRPRSEDIVRRLGGCFDELWKMIGLNNDRRRTGSFTRKGEEPNPRDLTGYIAIGRPLRGGRRGRRGTVYVGEWIHALGDRKLPEVVVEVTRLRESTIYENLPLVGLSSIRL